MEVEALIEENSKKIEIAEDGKRVGMKNLEGLVSLEHKRAEEGYIAIQSKLICRVTKENEDLEKKLLKYQSTC